MTVLHLGVVDFPYVDRGGQSTGDVAKILEEKYHVMQAFYDRHGDKVADAFANALAGALEGLRMGAPLTGTPFKGAESEVKAMFSRFLESQEIEGMGIAGVPTKAALTGVSHRFKGKVNKGKRKKVNGRWVRIGAGRRPSFIDTGTYETSFTDWVD